MSKQRFNDEFVFDSRIVQRNIRDGRIERSEYEQHVAALPDLEDQSEILSSEIFSGSHSGLAFAGDFVSNEQDE